MTDFNKCKRISTSSIKIIYLLTIINLKKYVTFTQSVNVANTILYVT